MSVKFTTKSVAAQEPGGYRFTFFCDECDSSYTTKLIFSENVSEAEILARDDARRYFNLCHRCEKWVCDRHYNEDVMMCVICAPRKDES